MVVPAGTKTVGTARVRDDAPMPYAQKKLAEKFGLAPAHGFDEIAAGDGNGPALTPAYRRDAAPSLGMAAPKKAPKYRNTKCEHEGIKFDSLRERTRWFHLVQEQAAGRISDLRLQVKFNLVPKQKRADGSIERAVDYVADFTYRNAAGELVVEDVKSDITRKNPTYSIKRKLMLERHGITIQEVM